MIKEKDFRVKGCLKAISLLLILLFGQRPAIEMYSAAYVYYHDLRKNENVFQITSRSLVGLCG